jgi:CubicO group peptidase (beta-lactamase class C family)
MSLAHLSEHSAALPRLPSNFWATVTDQGDPYRHYQSKLLYEFLSGAKLRFPPGSGVAYSNLGAGLLGHVLALRAGKPFEDLLIERVLRPLGLNDTGISLSADQVARLAPGHTVKGQPTSNWDLSVLAGAGGLRSTTAELLTFLRANLAPPETPIGAALRSCHAPRRVAWWQQIGIGVPHALGLAAASLLVQWAVPVPPGSLWFLSVLILPILLALGWKGFWSGVWTAVTLWVGCLMLWGPSFGKGPATVTLILTLVGSGYLTGHLPLIGRVRLGWQEAALGPGGKALWHNGGTGGYFSFVGFVPETRVGVTLLSNSANTVDQIGIASSKCLHEKSRTLGNQGESESSHTGTSTP